MSDEQPRVLLARDGRDALDWMRRRERILRLVVVYTNELATAIRLRGLELKRSELAVTEYAGNGRHYHEVMLAALDRVRK